MDELLEQFLIEGRDLVAEAHGALARLLRQSGDAAAIDALFRAVHTLKGSVALFDMAPAEALLHAAETRLADARKPGLGVEPATCNALIATIDQIDRWIDAMASLGALPSGAGAVAEQLCQALANRDEGDAPAPRDDRAWLDALRARPQFAAVLPQRGGTAFRYTPDPECFFRGEDPLATIAAVPALLVFAMLPAGDWPTLASVDPFRCVTIIEGISLAEPDAVRASFRLMPDQVQIAPLGGAATPDGIAPAAEAQTTTLRVEGVKLDRLARQAGELTVAIHGLRNLAAKIARIDPALAAELRKSESTIEQASTALRGSIADIRLVSLAPILRRLPRLARELAAALGKDMVFTMTGDGHQVDKVIADALFEPLLHLVRNAIDHGVEPPAGRAAAGKPAQARVTLALAIDGDRLAVSLEDDGGGIDPARMRASAVAKGLVDAETAAGLSDAQAQRLIFAPGFSTAEALTTVSGRGVGMDAVARTVERLQGTIDIASTPGLGTRFRLSLPLNSVTTRLLTISAGDGRYALRLDQIVETLRVEAAAIHAVGAGAACVVRDRTMPVIDLGGLLGNPGRGGAVQRLVLTEITGEPIALRVDALGERLDTRVRECDGLLAAVPGIGGTSVLADGGVLLVLDLVELLA